MRHFLRQKSGKVNFKLDRLWMDDCKALLPICSVAVIQKLQIVNENEAQNVVRLLLDDILIFKKVEYSHTLNRALETAACYVQGLYFAFLDREILSLMSEFTYKNLEILVELLHRCSTELLSQEATYKGCLDDSLASRIYYSSQTCRLFVKMIFYSDEVRRIFQKLLNLANMAAVVYKQLPFLGCSLMQILLESLESGGAQRLLPTETESLFISLFNLFKYCMTVSNDTTMSCLLADILSILFSYSSYPSLKVSLGNRLIRLIEQFFKENLFHEHLFSSGPEGIGELLLKLTLPLFHCAYQDFSSLSISSFYKILYLQTVYGSLKFPSNQTCNMQRKHERGYDVEPRRKKPRSNVSTNSPNTSHSIAEYSRLLSFLEEELCALQTQMYQVGAILAVQRLAMTGASIRYVKWNEQEMKSSLCHFILKYRSVVSDVFQIVLDRIDPTSSNVPLSLLKDILAILDCLFSVSEDEHSKHITFPMLELCLKLLDNQRSESSRIYLELKEICVAQLSSCQVTDVKAALDFINCVIFSCCNVNLSNNISQREEMYFLILEKSLWLLRQISNSYVASHSLNLFSYLKLELVMQFLNRCAAEFDGSKRQNIDELEAFYIFYLIWSEFFAFSSRSSNFDDKICVTEILLSLERSWETFFATWLSSEHTVNMMHLPVLRKYILAVVKLCVEIFQSQSDLCEELRRLLSRNLQYGLYVFLILGSEESTNVFIYKAVDILATLGCFSTHSEPFGPLKGIRCFSCMKNSTCSKLRSLELSFQCSGLCNLVALLISEKFMQSEHFSFVILGRLTSCLLKCFWNNYLRCNDSLSYHIECLIVILLDSLISWSSPRVLQDFSYQKKGSIDFKRAVKFSVDSCEPVELESFEVLFRVAFEHKPSAMTSEKVVSWFLKLFRDRLMVIGFYRLVEDKFEIYSWQSLFQSSPKDLWNTFATNVLRVLLVKNDFESAEFLASQCERSLASLTKENLGNIVATCVYQKTILEANSANEFVHESLSRLETCLDYICKIIECTCRSELFMTCKIAATKFLVQRLCKPASELDSLEKSLDSLSKLTGHDSTCSLISECFLALMDDLNQRIFLRLKYSLIARARSLKCLQRLFVLISSELHLFIPKILASLKLVLELEEELIPVGIETWKCFLHNLDPSQAGSHILTILSVLNPFIPSFPEQLGPSIARLVSHCSLNLFLIIDESYIPTELSSQPCLETFFQSWRTARESLSLQQQIDMLVSFMESPQVSTVKYAVLSRLQKLVESYRKQIAEILSSDMRMRSSVYSIITNLFLSLKSFDKNCLIMAADILGGLGAIDPVYLVGDIAQVETNRCMTYTLSLVDQKIDSLESFLQVLLCQYLMPCLNKSGTGMHQNVVGFALQELIRIYMNEYQQPPKDNSQNLEAFFSSQLYLSLTKDQRDLLVPYIHSSYSIVQTGHKKEFWKLDEIVRSKGLSTEALDLWIANLCILLVDTESFLDANSPSLSRVVQVCRNVYRLHPHISRFVFPYVLRQFLVHFSDRENESMVLSLIDSEMSCALKQGNIFASWVLGLVEEYRLVEENFSQDKVYRLDLICSRLKAFGGECSSFQRNVLYKFLKGMNDADLARAALKIGSYHRAIFYMEEQLRNNLFERGDLNNATVLVRSLQHAHSAIGDKDSLLGLLVLQKKKLTSALSLQESILEAESLENLDEVNALYNEALTSKCLTGLEISYVKHLFKLNMTEYAKYYAEKFSTCLEGIKQEQMKALHCAAAWRLSEWSELSCIDSFSHLSGEEIGEVCIGAYLGALSSQSVAGRISNLAKERIMRSMTDPSLGSYEKSYKYCVYLSILRELEWMKDVLGSSERCNDSEAINLLHQELTLRLQRTVSDVAVREPIVEARRICYKIFGDNYYAVHAMMDLATLEKENGNLHAAYLNVIRSENLFYSLEYNKDLTLLSEIEIEKADIYKKKGNLFNALETLESVVQGLESHMDQFPQGNRVSMDRQLARALVALGNVSEISHTCTTEVIASYYQKAVNTAPNFQDGFYYLARFYDRMLHESDGNLAEYNNEKKNGRLCLSENEIQYLSVAMENYTRTMGLGSKYIFESLPRLLTLWFNFEHRACVEKPGMASATFSEDNMAAVRSTIQKALETLPLWQWTTCISQILSRIAHPSTFVRQNLVQLTARLTLSYCSRMIWYLAPVINGKNAIRRKTGEKIVSMAEEMGGKDVCNTLRYGLAFIQQLSKICLQSTPKHVKKLSFSSNFDAFKKLLPCKQVVIPTKKAIMISYDESFRNDYLESTECSPWNDDELPTIYGAEDDIILMNSLMKPKRICLIGSDGNKYHFLCKREDSGDMRKDSRLMEFASVINRLLRNHQQSRSRQLALRTYAVLPLSEECGVIEWLSNLAPLRGIVFHLYHIFGISVSLGEIKEQHEKRTCSNLEFYRDWLLPRFPAVLRHFFVASFREPSQWFVAKKKFTYSCAVWSMIGYIVGLGDRHGENILIDMTSGECIHVDFACMFEKGKTLKVPEVVPFRLTPNMLDAMGPAGYEGSFRVASHITMDIARANRDGLMSVLETFLYDPLVEWERSGNNKYGSNKDKENIPVDKSALKPNAHALKARQSIDEKLQGIVKDSRSSLSIQGQVQRLILEATSEENLANMYIWWMPWI